MRLRGFVESSTYIGIDGPHPDTNSYVRDAKASALNGLDTVPSTINFT